MFEILRNYILKIFSHTWSGYLLEPFYPIVDDFRVIERLKSSKYQKRYVLMFISFSYILIENVMILLIMGSNTQPPYMLHHVILEMILNMNEYIRRNVNVIFPMGQITMVIISCVLTFNTNPHLVHVMFPSRTKFHVLSSLIEKKINRKLSKSLNNFWNRIKGKIEVMRKMFEIQSMSLIALSFIFYEIYKLFFIEGYQTRPRVWFCVLLQVILNHYFIIFMII